ncbi:LysR substrate-binding domain-containing protein [Bacillus haynesii]
MDPTIIRLIPVNFNHPNLFSRFLYEEEFQLVAPKVHPLTKKGTVELRECLKYPQIFTAKEKPFIQQYSF